MQGEGQLGGGRWCEEGASLDDFLLSDPLRLEGATSGSVAMLTRSQSYPRSARSIVSTRSHSNRNATDLQD